MPLAATTGYVVVTVNNLASNGALFTVLVPPSITNLSPTSGGVGTPVTITGANFGATQGSSTVSFNGVLATPSSWSDTSVVAPVPTGATTGNVAVIVDGLASNGLSFTVGSQSSNGPIQYTYDDLGRLIGVTDAFGNGAVYSYDTVGNILSISRIDPGQVSVIGFSPSSGSAGTTVTINGTGFSTTASQNAVTFNGSSASVTSSTASQIVATVPSGAATGPITVTAPNGSATSANPFVVASVLSITSVTPNIGVSGTAVTITGTNFDPTAANNNLKFNATSQPAIAVTGTTSIATTVPGNTASGQISISNISGVAGSGQDFFIPPPPYMPTDVGYTGRITVGGTTAVAISTASQIGLLLFDAAGGQQVQVQANNSSIPNCVLSLLDPFGNLLASVSCIASGALISPTLPGSGTYTIVVDTGGGAGGTVDVSVNAVSNTAGSIVVDGPPVIVNTTVSGQQASLLFKGTASQHVTMTLTNGTYTTCSAQVHGTTGASLASGSCSGASNLVDLGILPSGGNYTIWISPSNSGPGSVTVQLNSVTDITGTITVDGPPVPVTTTVPAQYVRLTFDVSATSGIHVAANVTSGTFPSCRLSVLNPNGFNIGDADCSGSTDSSDFELFAPGTYTLVIAPAVPATGSLTVQLTSVADLNASIVENGPPVTITTTTAGQNARVTFTGVAGQHITLQTTATSFAACEVTFYKPDGLMLIVPTGPVDYAGGCSSPTFIDIPSLPSTGTYTILLHPASGQNGSVTLQLNNVSDVSGTITIDGPPVNVTTTLPSQNANLTFNATAGQRVIINLSNSTFSSCYFGLYAPPGGGPIIPLPPKQYYDCTSPNSFLETLPMSGTYTIVISPQAAVVGSLTVQLSSAPPDITGTITIDGAPVTVTTIPAQRAKLTFSATAGQKVLVNLTNGSYNRCTLTLFDPSGLQVKGTYCGGSSNYMDVTTLAVAGTYTMLVDPTQAVQAGSVTVQLQSAPSDVTGTIAIDGAPVTVTTTTPFQDARLSFTATAGQRIVAYVTNITNQYAFLYLLKSDGTTQAGISFSANSGPAFMDAQTLSVTGTYQLWIQHSQANVGSETVQLSSVPADVTGTITIDGPSVAVNTTAAGQNAKLTFSGTAGQRVLMNLSAGTYPTTNNGGYYGCYLTLYGPSGNYLVSGTCGGATGFIDVATLSTTGTYTILIDPQGAVTGGVTVQLKSAPSDVTGTIAIDGAPVTVTTTVPGQDARLAFTANAGQRITVSATNIANLAATLYLLRPDGGTQALTYLTAWPNDTAFIGIQTLPLAGTYQLWVQHSSTNTGSETLQINSAPADISGTITIDGAPVTLTTTAPGQKANLGFSGTSGQKIIISLTQGTYSSCYLSVVNPGGSYLTYANCGGPSNTIDLTNTPLPAMGTYNLLFTPQGAGAGSVTVQVKSSPADVTGTISVDGAAVTVATTVDQDVRLTFSGTAGQRVALTATNVTNPSATVNVLAPDGSTQTSMGIWSGGSFNSSTVTLPATGTYTVWVQHYYTYFGRETLQLSSVPADVTGTIMIGGPPVTVTTKTQGQGAKLTFSATTGQKVTMNLTLGSYSSCYLTLYGLSGTSLNSGSCGGSTNFIDETTLPGTGTYTIAIVPQGTSTGTVTVQLLGVADVTSTIAIDGPPVTVTTTVAGQDARLTFSATAGQRINTTANNITTPTAYLNLLTPSGTNQASAYMYSSYGPTSILGQTLATTGTYQLWVRHYSSYVGSETLQISSAAADITGTIAIDGPPVTVTTTAPGQSAKLSFSGTGGKTVTINATSTTISYCSLTIYNPSGSSLAYGNCGGTNNAILIILPVTGTYTIQMAPQGTATGSMTAQVQSTASDLSGSIVIDGAAVTVTTTPGQDARLTFTGTAGQRIFTTINDTSNPYATMVLLTPNGTIQASASIWSGGTYYLTTQTLPSTGTYTLWIQHYSALAGTEIVQLNSVPADVSSSISIDGPPVTVTSTALGQGANLTFSATAEQKVMINLTGGTFNNGCTLSLSISGGLTLTSSYCGGAKNFIDAIRMPITGSYLIAIKPQNASTGSLTVQLQSAPADLTGTITPNGPAVPVSTTLGQDVRLTFGATSGQIISLFTSAITNPYANLYVLAPDGTTVTSTGISSNWGIRLSVRRL